MLLSDASALRTRKPIQLGPFRQGKLPQTWKLLSLGVRDHHGLKGRLTAPEGLSESHQGGILGIIVRGWPIVHFAAVPSMHAIECTQ